MTSQDVNITFNTIKNAIS